MNEHLNAFSKLEFAKVKKHIMRYAVSDLGREHIENLQPSASLPDIKLGLSLVTEMKELLTTDDVLPLEGTTDIRSSVHRASIDNYFLSSEDLRAIASVLSISKKIKVFFARKEDVYPLLYMVVGRIQLDKILEYNIAQAVDDEGKVRDSSSKELSGIRKQMVKKNDTLRKNLQRILKSVAGMDWIQEEIITTRDGRMVIPIKIEHKNRVPGFIHSSSATGQTVFIEPTETLDLNNEIRTLQFDEQREIERILKALTVQVAAAKELIVCNLQTLAQLDFIQAKAKFSIEVLGNEPRVKNDGCTRLEACYHPILLQKHSRNEVVPLAIELGGRVNTLVITGPNAGGKSVSMKTVGLLIVLAQAGCHIPASADSEIRLVTDMFVEMGDEQSIENDLSSFSSHLTHLKYILDYANTSSMVLIDEIGSGTDPSEGGSIAAAVLEHLSMVGCLTIVTTHHGALKTLAYENPRCENGAMEFDQASLTPTYRFRAGIPGSSYAVEMAERLHLPQPIIARAKHLRGSETNMIDKLLSDLERQSQEMRADLKQVKADQQLYMSLRQLYDSKVKFAEKEVKDIKTEAILEAQQLVDKANTTIEKTIREIKEHSASKDVIKSGKEAIRSIEKEFRQAEKTLSDNKLERTDFQIGDKVQLRNTASSGEVVGRPDADHVLVIIGAIKVIVSRDEVQLAPTGAQEYLRKPAVDLGVAAQREIDLRGMYGDEAIKAIEKFFDQAILSGLNRVNLIHGKGTGALRRKVNEYLKNNRAVKAFRMGEWNEGGSGVTMVDLQ